MSLQCTVSGECIDLDKTCNGVNDCSDSSDEVMPQCNDILVNSPENLPKTYPDNQPGPGAGSNLTTYLVSFFVLVVCLIAVVSTVVYCRSKQSLIKVTFLCAPLLRFPPLKPRPAATSKTSKIVYAVESSACQ